MAKQLQIKFDPHQDFQREAVQSVVRLLDGLPKNIAEFALNDEIITNLPAHESLSESWLLDNLLIVQTTNGIAKV